jgi:hypothetical protein
MQCFPGAEGFGTTTTHARDPAAVTVFVDNLDQDGPAVTAFGGGSLRQCLLYDGPAYIVFRVSGLINHTARALKFKKPNKYVAGQTSPGGVCLTGEESQVQSHDLLIRHMRFRTGEVDVPQADYDNRDCINSGEAVGNVGTGLTYNVVRDHCSGSWAVDECWTDWYDAHDMTDSNCLIGEGLFHSKHPKGPHSMGKLCGIQANRLSWHHTILANCNQRMPQIAGDTLGNSVIDTVNMLIFNWGEEGYAIEHLGNKINAVNNWFQIGPDFNGPTKSPFRVANSASDFQAYAVGNVLQDGRLTSDPNADNWPLFKLDSGATPPTLGHQMAVPFAAPAITTQTAFVARQLNIQNAGATKPFRNSVDLRILKQITQRCPPRGARYFVDSVQDAGGWPVFQDLPVPADSNNDGISDAWCVLKGFDPNDTIMNDDFGDGWSVMEHYLGELAGDVFP